MGVISILSSFIENAFCSAVGEGGEEDDNGLFGMVWQRALLHTVHTLVVLATAEIRHRLTSWYAD